MQKFDLTETDADKLVNKQTLKAKHLTLKTIKSSNHTTSEVLLLVDISGSMSGEKLDNLKKALMTVWNPGVKAIGFESSLWEIERSDIQNLTAHSSTYMLAALQEAWSQNPTHIVLLTDGEPTDGTKQEILAQVGEHPKPPIDTIGIGHRNGRDYSPDFLKEISRLTGGRFMDVGEPIQLTQTLKYLLDYKPTSLQEAKKGVIQL